MKSFLSAFHYLAITALLCLTQGTPLVSSAAVEAKASGEPFKVPELAGPVMDQVGLLGARSAQRLENAIRSLESSHGAQVQILIIPSLQGEGIEQVAIQVFDHWKLGQKKLDNGILFLIAPNERKLRIEVGRGFEGVLPDAIASRIIAETVVPFFRQQKFEEGIEAGLADIISYVKKEPVTVRPVSRIRAPWEEPRLWIFGGFFILFIVVNFFGGGGRGGPGRRRGFDDLNSHSWRNGGFSGGFGSGGGGGSWSGGGGGSSGGGSSGSW